jgi:UDP-glucose 4-epimerase
MEMKTKKMDNMPSVKKPAKTILVTGGCGYLGSQLIRDLGAFDRTSDITVRVLDNMQSNNYQALMNLPKDGRYQFLEGDILDPSAVKFALDGVDMVVHLAAIVRTPMSFEHPAWTEQVNHWGTSRLVDACLDRGITRFIYASSTAVYGPGGPFQEEDPCHSIGVYAQSKQKAETSIQLAKQRGLKPTVLRFGIIYGLAPVTRFDAVANRLAYLAGTRRPITIFGSGNQRRPFIHVRDASKAICHCLHFEMTSEKVFNAVSENASVLELAAALNSVEPSLKSHYTEQDFLTHLSFEANNSALMDTGWYPTVGLVQGLAELYNSFTGLAQFNTQVEDLE